LIVLDPAAASLTTEPASMSWTIRGVRLSSRIMPAARASRGGDWCEAFLVGEEFMALSVGDVCGHGAAKHSAMSATRQAIRDAARSGLDPAHVLLAGHRCLRAFDVDEYATAVFGLLDLRTLTLVFANAGHPPPLLSAPRESAFLEFAADLPLGIAEPFLPALREVTVPAGSLLVFYTDGVTERERAPIRGAAELRDAAIFATKFMWMPTALVIEKRMFLTGANRDDAAILTAWMPAGPGPQRTLTKAFERPF
jgi:serine phosphatase RsbU (regulator of sigma subunit)